VIEPFRKVSGLSLLAHRTTSGMCPLANPPSFSCSLPERDRPPDFVPIAEVCFRQAFFISDSGSSSLVFSLPPPDVRLILCLSLSFSCDDLTLSLYGSPAFFFYPFCGVPETPDLGRPDLFISPSTDQEVSRTGIRLLGASS